MFQQNNHSLFEESTESISCIVPRKAVIELQKILSVEKM